MRVSRIYNNRTSAKRSVWHSFKHIWHRSFNKARRLDVLYSRIEKERINV